MVKNEGGPVVRRSFHIGVDLGQRQSHSAVVVLEQQVVATGVVDRVTYERERRRRFLLRGVKQVPLRVGYHHLTEQLAKLTTWGVFARDPLTLTVDATGLGAVVAEDLERRKRRGRLLPVVLTGGQKGREEGGLFLEPRGDLLQGVTQAFEAGQLDVAPGIPEWEKLREELEAMRRRPAGMGVRMETVGRHDDLVFALAFALYGLKKQLLGMRG